MVELQDVISVLLDTGEWVSGDGVADPIAAGFLRVTGDPADDGLDVSVVSIGALARAVDRAAGVALPQAASMLDLLAAVVPPHGGLDPAASARYADLQAGLRAALVGIPPQQLDLSLNY